MQFAHYKGVSDGDVMCLWHIMKLFLELLHVNEEGVVLKQEKVLTVVYGWKLCVTAVTIKLVVEQSLRDYFWSGLSFILVMITNIL